MTEVEHGRFAIAFSSGRGAMVVLMHLLKVNDQVLVC
jgi:cystathionine beta-lyase/cystathionine gamma-synthase